jgi:hypothetical protein
MISGTSSGKITTAGSIGDAFLYLLNSEGSAEPQAPFCEAQVLEKYPSSSLSQTRAALVADRIQKIFEQGVQAEWIIDGVVYVKGLSDASLQANREIWAMRELTSGIVYWSSAVLSTATAVYGVFGTALSTALYHLGGDAAAGHVASVAFSTFGAQLASPLGMAVAAMFVAAATVWYIASNRCASSAEGAAQNQRSASLEVAEKRSTLLQPGHLEEAIKERGRMIAPIECEWLWMEAVRSSHAAFTNPIHSTGAQLTAEFARKNPFDHMEAALLEKGGVRAHLRHIAMPYAALSGQIRLAQEKYDQRADTIRKQAQHNREQIIARKRAAQRVVDSVYCSKVSALRAARDEKLRPFQYSVSSRDLDRVREQHRNYENNPAVIRLKDECRQKIAEYDRNRDLAYSAISAWFNPQVAREHSRERSDLAANHGAYLKHIAHYYPSVRSLLTKAVDSIDAYMAGRPISYEVQIELPIFDVLPMAPLLTDTPPEEPSSDTLSSWATAGAGLGLGFFLTAAAGAGFYAAYQASRSNIDSAINEYEGELPSAPDIPPPSYEEATGEAHMNYMDLPPSYDEATYTPAIPSAPPADPVVPSAPPV